MENQTTETSVSPSPSAPATPETMTKVAEKIAAAQNVLVALSSNPSVDELATAIGLSLFLDRLGKRATAIYSGTTPNVLEFLKPGEVFETSADALQDFVIALDKDKADHLRYKLDGDYVKIFITPFKNRISEADLNFSYGDFNVDLVLALNVASGVDLDSALREYGRIMHDAVIVDVATGHPGQLGTIEWCDEKASSVAEMFARMLTTITNETIKESEATAFLTGIVAATDRFSNGKTTPETMKIASELMRSGADQQLISKNISSGSDNIIVASHAAPAAEAPAAAEGPAEEKAEAAISKETEASTATDDTPSPEPTSKTSDLAPSQSVAQDKPEEETSSPETPSSTPPDATISLAPTSPDDNLSINHDTPSEPSPSPEPSIIPEPSPVSDSSHTQESPQPSKPTTTPEPSISSISDSDTADSKDSSAEDLLKDLKDAEASLTGSVGTEASEDGFITTSPKKVLQPLSSSASSTPDLSSSPAFEIPTPAAPVAIFSQESKAASPSPNPAASAAPAVPASPEINGVPEINYATPTSEILPPPPTPPVDLAASPLPPSS